VETTKRKNHEWAYDHKKDPAGRGDMSCARCGAMRRGESGRHEFSTNGGKTWSSAKPPCQSADGAAKAA
jgi:hypothetical protein